LRLVLGQQLTPSVVFAVFEFIQLGLEAVLQKLMNHRPNSFAVVG